MNTPIKDNEHIRKDKDAFIDAYFDACQALGSMEGVVGVGFGRKETADEFTENMAIHVYVMEKKPDDELAPEQRIPPTFKGYRTDVRVVQKYDEAACDNQTKYPEMQGGIQIQVRKKTSSTVGDANKGTLGCIVKKRNDTSFDNVYLLTCNHVVEHDDAGRGSYVYHPSAPPAGDTTSADIIGTVEDVGVHKEVEVEAARPGDGLVIPFDCFVDAAVVKLDVASGCCGTACPGQEDRVKYKTSIVDLDPRHLGNNFITDVRNVFIDPDIVLPDPTLLSTATDRNRVYKVGRTTGRTVGIVVGVNVTAIPRSATGTSHIRHGVIEIAFDESSTPTGFNCKFTQAFFEGGDSGSVVVDKDNKIIGLCFGSTPSATNPFKIRCFACHIMPVLDQLKVCVPTKVDPATGEEVGTSPGTTRATDGTGLTSSVPGDLRETPGKTLFASLNANASGRSAPELPPYTPERRERTLAVVAELSETARGRELQTALNQHRREIQYLVRNSRPVKVVWHRNRGPAFLAQLLNHIRGDADSLPREIGGVTRRMLLTQMGTVLSAQGSQELRAAIERLRSDVLALSEAETVDECSAALREAESLAEVQA